MQLCFLSISILDRLIYGIYCKRHFKEARVKLMFNKRIFKEMANIAGWSLFGNIAGVFYTQGLNVLFEYVLWPYCECSTSNSGHYTRGCNGFC